MGGFCAETAGAVTIIGAAVAGIPVSTTHTITGAIVGVGAGRRASAVRWGVARNVVWAWILTVPVHRTDRRRALRDRRPPLVRRTAQRSGPLERAYRAPFDGPRGAVCSALNAESRSC